ncbi:MAG: glycoside hydrolase [Marinilabiliales bacterium]|nr:MAG: glycoside hydrolase [Marinilabiliales bacterium]
MNKYLIIALIIIQSPIIFAQTKINREEYIMKYKELAIKEMHRSGIPASITLAQGLLESNNGNSKLAIKANNHFGIKCHSSWTGKKFHQDDDAKNECFRKYKSVYDSYKDHTDFLVNAKRYAFLFDLEPTDYEAWAKGLRKAGYATNPKYPQLLIKIIEDNQLYIYDKDNKVVNNSSIKNNHNKSHNNSTQKNPKKKEDNFKIDPYGRKIQICNNRKYIIVKPGDTFFSLNNEFDMLSWELKRYNDLDKNDLLKAGSRLYIQPKRNKAKRGTEIHIAKKGETMHDISQLYGIKLKKLYFKNNMKPGDQPNPGQKIYLRRRIPPEDQKK